MMEMETAIATEIEILDVDAADIGIIDANAAYVGIEATSATGISSGTQLSLSTRPNDTGFTRRGTVTITLNGVPTETIEAVQSSVVTSIRGQRVIECFARHGYVDVRGATTNTSIEVRTRASVARPLWNFVHLRGNEFAIRNDATGHYFTAVGISLVHRASISGDPRNPHPSQRWYVSPQLNAAGQPNGTYRIRLASDTNTALYVTEGLNTLTLAARNTHATQLWRIGFMWHVHRDYTTLNGGAFNWIGYWPGNVNIYARAVGAQPAGFNFRADMNTARDVWSDALDIEIRSVVGTVTANIKAYGGNRFAIHDSIDGLTPLINRYGVVRLNNSRDTNSRVTIQAGGSARYLYRLHGSGSNAMLLFVFSDNEDGHAPNDERDQYASNWHNIRFSTMVAIHELGHALGYSGHSPVSSDVMRRVIQPDALFPNTTLTTAEITHLRQIYRNFR